MFINSRMREISFSSSEQGCLQLKCDICVVTCLILNSVVCVILNYWVLVDVYFFSLPLYQKYLKFETEWLLKIVLLSNSRRRFKKWEISHGFMQQRKKIYLIASGTFTTFTTNIIYYADVMNI